MKLKSDRPYLIRGIYNWIVDNQLTPYLLVDVTKNEDDISIPMQYVDNGRIVLNIGPTAVNQMNIGDETISFTARFNGQAFNIVIPCGSVLAMYAKEIGQGMMFNEKYASTINTKRKRIPSQQNAHKIEKNNLKARPHLTLVK